MLSKENIRVFGYLWHQHGHKKQDWQYIFCVSFVTFDMYAGFLRVILFHTKCFSDSWEKWDMFQEKNDASQEKWGVSREKQDTSCEKWDERWSLTFEQHCIMWLKLTWKWHQNVSNSSRMDTNGLSCCLDFHKFPGDVYVTPRRNKVTCRVAPM